MNGEQPLTLGVIGSLVHLSEWVCGQVCVCLCARPPASSVLLSDVSSWEVCAPRGVSLALWACSVGQRQYPGSLHPVSQQLARSKALPPPQGSPRPTLPFEGPRPVTRLLRNNAARGRPGIGCFQVCLSAPPAAIVFPLWHLLLDVSELQHCSPGALSGPLRLSPAPDPSGFTRTQKTSSALSPQPVLSSAVRPARGAPPSHQGFGPS